MEITTKNFSEQLDDITKNLKRSCFVGFDAEFSAILSGETFKHRLFDSNEERYDKLKSKVNQMIMTQIGLTMFQYNRDIDTYNAVCYTFHLCPQVFGDIDQSFIFQASTVKFLCRHNFDFNKFTYFGLPYLSKAEEEVIKQQLEDKTLFQNLSRSLEIEDERLLQSYCSEVSKWLSNSEEGTLYLDIKNPVLRFITHNEIRMRFPGVLTTDSLGNSNKVLIYRDKSVEGANSSPKTVLEENFKTHLLGFSQIIDLLASYKKPIIGHNIFLDTILLHNQFIGPLPNKYSTFKKNIHELFPNIYDTKYISHEMAKMLTFDEVWKSNALQDLYEFFSERKCKKLEQGVNPIRLSIPFAVKQSYHEAGWDSYCSGYCFIRLGHWAACVISGKNRPVGPRETLAAMSPYCNRANTIRGAMPYVATASSDWAACVISGKYQPVGPRETLAAMSPYCNRANTIRGAMPYVNFIGEDPKSHRPNVLHIKALKDRVINVGQVASTLANFGNIDIKPYGSRTALIATSTQYTADKILKQFKNSREYRISEFSVYKHSVASRVAIWSGALLTGSLMLYFFHRKMK